MSNYLELAEQASYYLIGRQERKMNNSLVINSQHPLVVGACSVRGATEPLAVFLGPPAPSPSQTPALAHLTAILRHGSRDGVPCARVSRARAKGAAKAYPYWGTALYRCRLDARGRPSLQCTRAASSDRRSRRLAEQDAEATGRIVTRDLGRVSEDEARRIVDELCAGARGA